MSESENQTISNTSTNTNINDTSTEKTNHNYPKIAIILSGDADSLFWPRSTKELPEQFVHLLENKTLFQRTYNTIKREVDKEDIWVVINEKHKHLALEQVQDLDADRIITEPFGRHTAPAIGLALAILSQKYSDETIFCIFPSDHYIKNFEELNFSMNIAIKAAYELKGLITIGIEPDRPETHYGYIQYSDSKLDVKLNDELYDAGLRYSINFAEKPDKITARRFINSGDFVWNCGILVARQDTLLEAYKKYLNYHYEQFNYLQHFIGTPEYEEELNKLYMTFNRISLDYGILEHADNVYVVKSTFTWTDLHDWDELFRISLKDALNNVLVGNVVVLESKNSLIISDEKPVCVLGMEDVIMINTEKAVLLCKRDASTKVAELVDFLRKKNIPLY